MKATPHKCRRQSLQPQDEAWQLGGKIAINEAKLNNFRQRSEAGSLALRKQEVKLKDATRSCRTRSVRRVSLFRRHGDSTAQ